MSDIQDKILKFTNSENINDSLELVFSEYLKFKTFYLKNEISRFELKWSVNFDEFKKIFDQMANFKTKEIEEDIEEWGSLISELDYFVEYQKNGIE
ncbi:MAG: hypothetical protein HN704_16305 [Bacteroidetes bacterium]|jgi:hypothetical protein|nr:hypothetical protein [Bacteroidota bacterium]MBT6687229.1 hypothetical protein [Bacteroidota bacterium]MBT7144002.1 hypothetical protein [Bacteroidota bacterium]MBT7493161.1 hypothetical protein [Bacteroidota bacterium]